MLIVSGEPFADIVSGNADDRILPGVVTNVAMKQFDADGPLLQPLEATLQRILDHIAEQHLSAMAAAELRAVKNGLSARRISSCPRKATGWVRLRVRDSALETGPRLYSWGTARETPAQNAIT